MLDQSFSTDNFRKIFDLENRKGNYLEGDFFPELEKLSQKVQANSHALREIRRNRSSYALEKYQELKSKAKEQLESYTSDWESELVKQLDESVSKNAN